jgi:hypothetical protein
VSFRKRSPSPSYRPHTRVPETPPPNSASGGVLVFGTFTLMSKVGSCLMSPYRAGNVPVWRRIPALDRTEGPETGSRALRDKILVYLDLRKRDGWQRERCRNDEPAQRSEHDTPPAAQTPPRLHCAKRIEKLIFELRFSRSFSLSVALKPRAALRFSLGADADVSISASGSHKRT